MYAVKNSSRALLVALIPLAAVHVLLHAFVLLGIQGTAAPGQAELPAPDKVLISYVTRLAIDAALLFAGHLALRQGAIHSRMAYGLMGGTMAAAGYAFAIRDHLASVALSAGSEITIGLLPVIAGMIAGFLYSQVAGLETVAGRQPQPSTEAPAAPRTFDGPVRVRSSLAAVAISAVIPAVMTALLSFMFMALVQGFEPKAFGPGVIAGVPAQMFLAVLIATIVPSAIFVLATHHIARAFGRSRGLEYAAIGSGVAALCVFLIAIAVRVDTAFVLLPPAIMNGAIMGALYRRFAGIEPVPLPEAVIATDEHALVGADHPSRREHGVILSN
ncbi:hypothetical protein [Bradyrhizobium sp.]|uniref:hypothetical protein n=1 Tax=Bradyrhizobium sp. TaxID=376 RepID=UPI004038147F